MGKHLVVGFAGHGDVERENVFALLDDQLQAWDEMYDDYTLVVPPAKRGDKALKHVLAFLEDEEVGLTEEDYDSMVTDAASHEDVLSDVIDYIEDPEGKREGLLILAPKLDEEGSADELTERLMEQADAHGIPVKDLTHALDDLIFDDDEDSTENGSVEPEPEEEPEKPRKRRSRPEIDEGRQETLDDLKELREASEERTEVKELERKLTEVMANPVEPAADEAQAQTPSFAGIMEAENDLGAKSSDLIFAGNPSTFYAPKSPANPSNAAVSIGEQIETLVRQLVREEVSAYLSEIGGFAEQVGDPVITAQEPLPNTTTTNSDDEEMVTVLENPSDGTWRKKGRGRPRKDEIIRDITKKEARKLGIDV